MRPPKAIVTRNIKVFHWRHRASTYPSSRRRSTRGEERCSFTWAERHRPSSSKRASGRPTSSCRLPALTADGSQNYHARLSPDDTQVAFDSDRDGERAVYIAQRDGSRLRRVSGAGFAAIPTWSPDGSMLAFVRGEAARPHVWNLWVLEVASNRLERFTSHRYGQLWGASWFPHGRRVCYSHEGSLYVLDLTNGDRQQFDSPIAGRMVRTPAVSPDGGRIVFQVQRNGVWLLELADRSMRRILTDASAEEFTWDPPGRRVAYHSRRDGRWRIWITATPPPAASETQESPPS